MNFQLSACQKYLARNGNKSVAEVFYNIISHFVFVFRLSKRLESDKSYRPWHGLSCSLVVVLRNKGAVAENLSHNGSKERRSFEHRILTCPARSLVIWMIR